ncbi:hypothetical protein MTR67_027699 [Solanum verrucosum]|uniref:Uncharacterized protein n=1 Tax=Solanum verrucosum TaxID=315347 RepID=A0AAF0TVY1_SOLVR|nr:hypothetical protein MTR67_027699 [Solanum verrucosum]
MSFDSETLHNLDT